MKKLNDQIIRITRALNHPIRIQILYYLNDHQKSSVNNLVKQFDVSQPAISRHLRILEEAKLVKSERVKQEKYYSLADNHIIKILDVLRQHVKEQFEFDKHIKICLYNDVILEQKHLNEIQQILHFKYFL